MIEKWRKYLTKKSEKKKQLLVFFAQSLSTDGEKKRTGDKCHCETLCVIGNTAVAEFVRQLSETKINNLFIGAVKLQHFV